MQVSCLKPNRRYFRGLQKRGSGSTEKDFHYSEVRFRKAESLRHPSTNERGRSSPQHPCDSGSLSFACERHGHHGASPRSAWRTAAPLRSPHARRPYALLDRCRDRASAPVVGGEGYALTGADPTGRTKHVCLLTTGGLIGVRRRATFGTTRE